MSSKLTQARAKISSIKSFLKQEKYIPAVEAFHQAVRIVLSQPLMKQEKDEFTKLIEEAAYSLDSHSGFRQYIPLKISYTPGKEKELLSVLSAALGELRKAALSDAKSRMAALEQRKQEGLQEGQQRIDAGEYPEAQKVFDALIKDIPGDADLKGDIGERFLKAGRYEEAFHYLSQALEDSPESIHFYNRIGIALRKLSRFETAEKYFMKALSYVQDDANLFFNIGRLYVDWKKWDEVEDMATRALKIQPEFVEARKMLVFARKKKN